MGEQSRIEQRGFRERRERKERTGQADRTVRLCFPPPQPATSPVPFQSLSVSRTTRQRLSRTETIV
jgi:hypothetical protein